MQQKISAALTAPDPVERYWAATVCASFGPRCRFAEQQLSRLTTDEAAFVQSRAAVALSLLRNTFPQTLMPRVLRHAQGTAETLQVLNDMAFLQEHFHGRHFTLPADGLPAKSQEITWRLKYLTEGFPPPVRLR